MKLDEEMSMLINCNKLVYEPVEGVSTRHSLSAYDVPFL